MMHAWTTTTPPDHDTVWGFLAKTAPWMFELLVDPIHSPMEDQTRGLSIAGMLGYDPVQVPSPPALREAGVSEVFAFPTAVLLEVYPANPD